MVRIGIIRIKNPFVNFGVAILLIVIALTIGRNESIEAKIIMYIVATFLIGRGIFYLVQSTKSGAKSHRFAEFIEEEKGEAGETQRVESDS